MKKIIVLLALALSSHSFATECSSEAKDIAKINLDQVAKKYGFESSDIVDAARLVKTVQVKGETLSVFAIDGYIYKGSYTVTATLDSMCALRKINIQEDQ